MRRRLLATNAMIALAAVLVLGLPLAIVEAHRERADAETQLEREADAVAAAVDDRIEAGRPLDVAALRVRIRPGHEVTIRPRRGAIVRVGGPIRGDRITVGSGAADSARVTASAPSSEVTARVERRWALIGLLSLAGITAAVALGALQGRRLARPLERLARTSTRLGEGDFSTRAERSAIPEIDAVAAALDSTAIRIARLLGREREFAANAAHQLRTPLTALRLRLEEIEALGGADVAAETAPALHEVDRLQATIADLLAHAENGRAGDAGPLDVAELVRAHAERWRPLYARAGRPLAVEAAAGASAGASAGAVGQAVDVLIENALQHGGGAVTVSVEDRDGRAVIAVADEGDGVPAGAERAIFERGGSPAGGTGVGLHLARALVEADGGRLRLVRPRPARFEIALRS
ncbi:MAG TPA: HAMP domain-containing sensor histidine kinase [Solirubrobacteraceae bacterium]|nr:HAMP domain-containing sensor histidine kinase [Solirubrobacteraceae bacterium]